VAAPREGGLPLLLITAALDRYTTPGRGGCVKSLSNLWRLVADDLATGCHTSATRDFNTVKSRIEDEGFSFMTITLPQFGKDFERSLELGCVDDAAFPGFRRRGGLPIFMSGFLRQIFDVRDGVLLDDPSIDCIFAVRQLSLLFSKIELPCSNSRVVRAMEGFVQSNEEVQIWECAASPGLIQEFRDASRILYADAFSAVDDSIYHGRIQPRHGPGATADGLAGNGKFVLQTWHSRLEEVFPYGEYVLPNWRYYRQLDHVDFLEPGAETPVKVISVPKTLKSPRIIAEEPTCMQYMQQAISRALVEEFERPTTRDGRENFLSHFLGFTDQIPNREMAREGSTTGRLATLDLREASDRVPESLVKVMAECHPWLSRGLFDTRSTRATIGKLGVSIPRLYRYASMGSALCFPVEAAVFLTVVMIGIKRHRGLRTARDLNFKDLVGDVRVYGDDIIVPTDCVDSVIEALRDFNCVVNIDKSFWNGKFRESCGGDYYDGTDVTPVRCRAKFPSSRMDGSSVASLIALRNLLYMRGLWRATSSLDERIERLLGGRFPIVEPTSPALGRHSVLAYQPERIDDWTHAPRVRAFVQVPRLPKINLADWGALRKCLSSSVMFEDARHLERSGRAVAVDIKLRWVSPF